MNKVRLEGKPYRYRFHSSIIRDAIWLYTRFNNSYRDVAEQLAYRGIIVSHETIRSWEVKFGELFKNIIRKKFMSPNDKWHLDEVRLKIKGEYYVLWRAVDSNGFELDVFLQKRRNKKAAIRFLSRLLKSYPAPRVIITDKLNSYKKPIKYMYKSSDHRSHKGLNNRAENSHLYIRRKEKSMIKFKTPRGTQRLLSLMGTVRNLFSIYIGRYKKTAKERLERLRFALSLWSSVNLSPVHS